MHKQVLKLVFSNSKFLVLSIAIFVGMLFSFSILLEYLFLEPFLIFEVPYSEIFDFSLIVFISALTGLVLSMGIYRVRILRTRKLRMSPGVIGSIMGAGTGACGCLSMNLVLVPLLLPIAGLVTIFETYAIPLRLLSIAILGFSYFLSARGISSECNIKLKNNN